MKIRFGGEERLGKIGKALRAILIMIFLFQALLPLGLAQNLGGIPSSVKSLQDLEKWLSDFTYQMKIPDVPQSVKETLDSKAGDCDDLARVVFEALAGLGIASDIVVIKTKGMAIRHAICIWKDENGNYSFFSNKQLIHTGENSLEGAIQKHFRRYESSSILSPQELKSPENQDSSDWGRSRGYLVSYKHGVFH